MTDTPQPHPFEDLRTTGLLWALNRYVLHPRGMALGLAYKDGSTVADIEAHRHEPIGFTIYGPDNEPWQFDIETDRTGFDLFNAFTDDGMVHSDKQE